MDSVRFLSLLIGLAAVGLAQEPGNMPIPEQTEQNATATCLQPPPLLRMEDYNGPLPRLVGWLGRKVELTSVHPPHYKPGAMLCSLEPGAKFDLFVRNTVDPVSFLTAGFNAGIASGSDPSFGQGVAGYSKRFGAAFGDATAGRFFSGFVYPTVFSEDPRYYRLSHGSGGKRLWHALEHTFVGHKDSGKRTFNGSEWLGTASAVAAGYAWHPGNAAGFGPAARTVGINIATDTGFDVLREFWPEIARKLKMPFRDRNEAGQAGMAVTR